jgi:DNA-directed RNA polymerase specialized sigma24 family protein
LTDIPPTLLTELHRLACLLRGDAATAGEDLAAVIVGAGRELAQLRNDKAALALLVSKLRARIPAAPEVAGTEEDDMALFLRRFSALPEPGRTALALFYLDLFPIDEIAGVMGMELDDLAALIGTGRAALRESGAGGPS